MINSPFLIWKTTFIKYTIKNRTLEQEHWGSLYAYFIVTFWHTGDGSGFHPISVSTHDVPGTAVSTTCTLAALGTQWLLQTNGELLWHIKTLVN